MTTLFDIGYQLASDQSFPFKPVAELRTMALRHFTALVRDGDTLAEDRAWKVKEYMRGYDAGRNARNEREAVKA